MYESQNLDYFTQLSYLFCCLLLEQDQPNSVQLLTATNVYAQTLPGLLKVEQCRY